MKIVVTGASGLLGRAVLEKALARRFDAVGLAFTRTGPGLKKVDITCVEEMEGMLLMEKPDFVIHAAAERFPDKVEKQYEKTRNLNIKASGNIAQISKLIGARVIYISTDYVFDGANPPYTVDDTPRPLNKYGVTKLEGERAVLDAHPGSLVLRVPVLYGPVERINESAVTCLLPLVKNSQTPATVSNYEKRYPAHVQDIAEIICQLIEKAAKDDTISGIFQWSGLEQLTKYDMCLVMARIFGFSHSHITPENEPSPGAAPRPYDSRMDNSRLQKLGIECHMPFEEGIRGCLQQWIDKV